MNSVLWGHKTQHHEEEMEQAAQEAQAESN